MPGFGDLYNYYHPSADAAAAAPSTSTALSPVSSSSASPTVDLAAVTAPSTATSPTDSFVKRSRGGQYYVAPDLADQFFSELAGESAIPESYQPYTRFGETRRYAVPGLDNVGVRRSISRTDQQIPYGSLVLAPMSDPTGGNAFANIDPYYLMMFNLMAGGLLSGVGAGATGGSALTGESAALASTIGGASGTGLTAAEAAQLGTGAASVQAGGGLLGSEAGGMLDTVGNAAIKGGVNSAMRGGDPVEGALYGGLTAGAVNYAAPAIASVFDTYNPDINYADLALDTTKRTSGTLGGDSAAGFFEPVQVASNGDLSGMLAPSYAPDAGPAYQGLYAGEDTGARAPTGVAAGMLPPSYSPDAGPAYQGLYATPAAPAQPAPQQSKQPSAAGDRIVKLGMKLAEMGGGQAAPQDAPQRAEGQSDADYAQSLATYINVDAQALADMGLVPGTPAYYDYLMSQLDATINDMAGTLDVNAPDLEQQLRAKTGAELAALQRALYVRGQLGQLMGSGTYTDPFTGAAEDIITNGMLVNPGVAAYHRGLGRTAGEFAGLQPADRKRAVDEFLGRAPDLYGMQARSDARDAQAAQAQAVIEDLKRRRGMFGDYQSGSQSLTGDPELDSIFGMGGNQDEFFRMLLGQ